MNRACRNKQGFTLLELSIVLAIIALVTGMAITSGVAVISTARQSATEKKMAAIDLALMAYRTVNDRLPCPGDLTLKASGAYYGQEAAVQGSCTGESPAANNTKRNSADTAYALAEGAVPTLTLGLPNDYMYDGWGNHFRYAVDASLTIAGSFVHVPTGAICGPITVKDASGAARTSGAVYALISHGANGHGAYTLNGVAYNASSANASEQKNCHCDSSAAVAAYDNVYIQMSPTVDSSDALNSFDDIVTYKERWQMATAWDRSGTLCPAIYIADSGNHRIEKFDINGNYLGAFGASGSGDGQLNTPKGIAVDSTGNIWVVDSANNRIQKFNSSGSYVSKFGATGTGNGQITTPFGVAIDANGNLWVTDSGNNRIQILSTSGTWLQTVGGNPSCFACLSATSCYCVAGAANATNAFFTFNGYFSTPRGISLDASGNAWVADSGNNRVQGFNSSGWLLQVGSNWPAGGSGDGQFTNPYGTAIDAKGNLWVTDYGNNRVEVFNTNSNGAYVTQFGTSGSGNGQFSSPYAIAFDAAGNAWVTDYGNHRVQKFDSNGNYLNKFGASGSGDGQFTNPTGIAIVR